jgi:hypothetical protein
MAPRLLCGLAMGIREKETVGHNLHTPIFRWLHVPASILAVLGFTAFVSADIAQMKTLRSIAASVVVAACLLAVAAALLGWYERQRPKKRP